MSTWGITKFAANEVISCKNVNSRIAEINNLFPVPISHGGTGATTAEGARQNLSLEKCELLYQNVSGTSNTITLPTKAALCNRWGIYYGVNNIGGYQECDPANSATINLYETYETLTNNLYIRSALAHIDKNTRTITLSRNSVFILYLDGTHGTSDEQIKIYNVIGYTQ